MKSPIAQNEIRKYLYPAPLDAKADGGVYAGSLIDDEVMADIASGEPAPWLILKIPHAKGLKDAIADALQSVATPGLDGAVLSARIAQGNSHTFEILIDDWSFDLPKTAQTFGRLDSWSAAWGDNGYGYLPYAYIDKYMTDGWTAVDIKDAPPMTINDVLKYGAKSKNLQKVESRK